MVDVQRWKPKKRDTNGIRLRGILWVFFLQNLKVIWKLTQVSSAGRGMQGSSEEV